MKVRILCLLLLVTVLHGCTVYRPNDVLAYSDKLRVYWVNPAGGPDPILMGEDSSAVGNKYKELFTGNAIATHTGNAEGKIDFLRNGVVALECSYSLGASPWIAYLNDRDTVFLQLSSSSKALLANYKAPTPERFAWLAGTWVAEGDSRPIYEEWAIGVDHYPVGRNYSIYGGDTTINEELSIKPDRSRISYMAKVFNQNNGKPVFFDWKPCAEEHVIAFSNPAHDFPQDITYKLISPDSLVAVIKGQGSQFEMGMKRIATKPVTL
jgi:hypothetical protein